MITQAPVGSSRWTFASGIVAVLGAGAAIVVYTALFPVVDASSEADRTTAVWLAFGAFICAAYVLLAFSVAGVLVGGTGLLRREPRRLLGIVVTVVNALLCLVAAKALFMRGS
jgi:hypothetical protein